MIWFAYILRCGNGSYYVGHTSNTDRRLIRHRNGTGAQHTATYHPECILHQEEFGTEGEAVRRELQIKRWSRAKKEALIAGNMAKLRSLSRSRE